MRRANFKLPNQKSLVTGQSTYKNNMSDVAEDPHFGDGRAALLTNLKKSTVQIGGGDSRM